jgi:hypothetical protein
VCHICPTRSGSIDHPDPDLATRLETRRNFFSNRVEEAWNMVPGVIKRSKTMSSFKNAYRKYRENMVKNAWDGIET